MTESIWGDIHSSDNWINVTEINKGWSDDRKFMVETDTGEKFSLRVCLSDKFEKKQNEFERLKMAADCGIYMSKPVEMGYCSHGKYAYMLLTWVDGIDLEDILTKISVSEQYRLGQQAGRILKQIHSVSSGNRPITDIAEKKLKQLEKYEKSNLRIKNDEEIVYFIKSNINCLINDKTVLLHGDFHPGNLIYTPDGNIGVIDFNRSKFGYSFEDFLKLQHFGQSVSPYFASAQINAYFGRVPQQFWQAFAVYVAHTSLWSIIWAEKFGQQEVDKFVNLANSAFEDFDNFKNIVPKWYIQP